MNTDNYNLLLSSDQHYKLITLLTSYMDMLGVNDNSDDEIDELRSILVGAWKNRFTGV